MLIVRSQDIAHWMSTWASRNISGGIKPCYFSPDLRVKLVNLLDRPDVGRCYLPEPDVMVAVPEQNRHVQPLCPLLS